MPGLLYIAGPGAHEACLDAPAEASYELTLWRLNETLGRWLSVARAEPISNFVGPPGGHALQVRSVSGSGAYVVGLERP